MAFYGDVIKVKNNWVCIVGKNLIPLKAILIVNTNTGDVILTILVIFRLNSFFPKYNINIKVDI